MENEHITIIPPEEENTELPEEEKKPSTAIKVVVLIALILLLAVGILLPIKFVPSALTSISSTFSSLFRRSQPVAVSADRQSVASGETLTLSWTGADKRTGSYVLSYECQPGVNFHTSINEPDETIPCGTPFYFTPESDSIAVTPFSTTNRYSDVPISLSFLANGAASEQKLGDTRIAITNPNIAAAPNQPSASNTSVASSTRSGAAAFLTSPTISSPRVLYDTDYSAGTTTGSARSASSTATSSTIVRNSTSSASNSNTSLSASRATTSAYRASNPNGAADLSVRIVSTGIMNSATAALVPATSIRQGQRAAMRFSVTNHGDKSSGVWSFTAALPSNTNPTYTAYNLPSLRPGESIAYTLGFENIGTTEANAATITIDPSSQITESNEGNNSATAVFSIIRDGSSYPINISGRADLSVRVIGTGLIDRTSGRFYQANYVNSNDRAGVQFEVRNIGGQTSGSWQFSASLPTSDYQNSNYVSEIQPSLDAGQTSTFTIGFDRIQNQGNNTVTITVDPQYRVDDPSRSNNTASATIYRY